MIDLDAIRARDAEITDPDFWPSAIDRRALLAYVDELREAAGKVTCEQCKGTGTFWSVFAPTGDRPCPACTDLRRLLGEKP